MGITRDKQLRNVDYSVFQQKAVLSFNLTSAEFRGKHPRRKIVGLPTTCNALSRKAGGQAGQDVCQRIASRVSQLDDVLIGKVGIRALSIFAPSFGR
ncbi:hypothetical protein XH87_10500 [Bradyrhizobium sp. CCBAU 53415]|nr:hypothetical protein [Bradyrhizobium sp. CCBAU 53415]